MKKLLLILSITFISKTIFSLNITSTAVTGNWNATTSWVGGVIPGPNDSVFIVNTANITLNIPSVQVFKFQINTGGIFNCGANTLALYGHFVNNGAFNAGTGTVNFNGFSFIQPILGLSITTFYNLTINNTNGIASFGVTAHPVETRIVGNFTNNGVFNRGCTGYPSTLVRFMGPTTVLTGTNSLILHNVVINAGASVTHSTPNIYVTGNWINNLGGIFIPNSNTVNFEYSSCGYTSLTVNNGSNTFYNVSVNKAPTFTVSLANTTTITNNFSITAGTWSSNSHTLNVGGHFFNSGTYDAGTGLVFLNGALNQNITMGGSTLYNLKINKAGGSVYGLSIVEVTNNANLQNGIFYTHANMIAPPTIFELYINNNNPTTTLTGFSVNSFVIGRLRRQVTAGLNNYSFPIGPMNVSPVKYRPIIHQQTSSGGAANISMIADTISFQGNKANWYVRIGSNAGNPIGNFGFSYNLLNDFPPSMPECVISAIRGPQPPPANWNYVLNTITPASAGTITSAMPALLAPNSFILGEATPIASGTTICNGSNATFSITSPTGFVQFNWWSVPSGGSPLLTGSNSFTTPVLLTNTTYYMTSTTLTCTGIRTPVTVSVNPLPTITINNPNPQICIGGTINLTAFGASSTSNYTWTSIATGTDNITVSPLTNTSYSVIGIDINGCKNSAVSNLTVNALPSFTAIATSTVCTGSNIILDVIGNSLTNYSWTGPNLFNSLISTNTISPASNLNIGTYTVVVTNSYSCTNTQTVSVSLFPQITAVASADIYSGVAPLSVNFTNSSLGVTPSDNYNWTFGDGGSSSIMNPNHLFTNVGIYNVILAVTDLESGCLDTAMLIIKVEDDLIIIIPNVFTPNNDGSNDSYYIKIKGAKSAEGFIYNRWGQLLFSWDAINASWDGNASNGEICPDATYFYLIKVVDLKEKEHIFPGNLLIVR